MTDKALLDELYIWANAAKANAQTVIAKIDAARAASPIDPLPRVKFACPLGGFLKPNGDWPDGIFSATDYGEYYTATGKPAYHPGVDLNHVVVAKDVSASVYATADGQIMFAGTVSGWQGQVIIQRVLLEDQSVLWVRYAHVTPTAKVGDIVNRGDQIATLVDYTPVASPSGDHLHFDIAVIDLNARPGDWPGTDRARVLRDYLDPAKVLSDRA